MGGRREGDAARRKRMLASAAAMVGHLSRVSIVIPALDEERAIGAALDAALAQADEVVVSDGGSRDRTVEIALRSGARVVCGPRGRGLQLNRGAAAATAAAGDILLFLHADTTLPHGGVELVRRAIAAGAVGGAFRSASTAAAGSTASASGSRACARVGAIWRSATRLSSSAARASIASAASATGRCSRTSTSCCGCGQSGRIAIVRQPVVTSARRFRRPRAAAYRPRQLVDLDPVRARRAAGAARERATAMSANPRRWVEPRPDAQKPCGDSHSAGLLASGSAIETIGTIRASRSDRTS